MMHINLSGTDLHLSRACFGTMTFGGQVTEQSVATRMVDYCIDAGINFFDTANAYGQGASEAMLGKALWGRRDNVVLASKLRGRMGENRDECGLSSAAILRAVEDSLRRLKTDYLDVYYLHQPDYDVPIEETLEVMDTLVKHGKVRNTASSNYSSWQVCQMLWLAERRGYRPALLSQQMYNLLARGLEQEFIPFAKEFGVSIIAYNPLAGGLLTGKHRGESVTPGTRFDKNAMYVDRYWHRENFYAIERLHSAAEIAGRSLVSLSLNWLLNHTATDCVILGASKLEQLEQNIAVLDEGPLPQDVVQVCDAVWNDLRGPVPVYNR
jgi:aryl-alcohol dehydrogenase-like predicted oxidoreductase